MNFHFLIFYATCQSIKKDNINIYILINFGGCILNEKLKFIDQIIKNLKLNGYPDKKVSFDLEKMYELADNKGFSFNEILNELENTHNIYNDKIVDKIIFSKPVVEQQINQDTFKEAQDMMSKMSPEELENMKQMYENMSDQEKQNIMDQAKKMGLF